MTTIVTRIDRNNPHGDYYDVYCGRANPLLGLKGHELANPFRIGRDGTRADVIRKYRNRLMSSPHLLRLIPTIKDKRLACWCHGHPRQPGEPDCHLDLIAELADNPQPITLTTEPMDPTTQECFGWHGYGSGFFQPEGQALAAANRAVGGTAPSFCDKCPKRNECWTEHQRRVGETDPTAVKAYFARVAEYASHATNSEDAKQSYGRVARDMAVEGNPDPWMAAMLRNFKQGAIDRHATHPPTTERPS